MGSTMFEGGSITKGLQLNQVKLPQTKITFSYKELQSVTMSQHIQKIQGYSKIQEL